MKITVTENWDGFGADDTIDEAGTQTEYSRLLAAEILISYPMANVEVNFEPSMCEIEVLNSEYPYPIRDKIQSARERVYDTHAYWADK